MKYFLYNMLSLVLTWMRV